MQIHRLKPTVLATIALLSAACTNDVASPDDAQNGQHNGIVAGNLEVSAASGAVKMHNTTEQQVGYMVVDKDQLVVAIYPASFPPCGNVCPIIVQGQSASVPYTQIPGRTSKSTHAVVMWWKYSLRADGTRVPEGAMQSTLVQYK